MLIYDIMTAIQSYDEIIVKAIEKNRWNVYG